MLIMFLILLVISVLCCVGFVVLVSSVWKVSILLKIDVVFVSVSGVEVSNLFCVVVRC